MYSSWVEISKSAILHNLAQYKKIVSRGIEIMPIVKSNAYGHGMVEIARLVAPKVKWLGVVSLGEAIELRKNNIRKRIFVLSYIQGQLARRSHEFTSGVGEGIKQNIDLPVYDLNTAKVISRAAKKLKKTAKVHIKIDTGVSRVGVLPKEAVKFIQQVKKLPNLKIEGLYSHFAASEENQKYTQKQLADFNQVLAKLDFEIPFKHFACSAATLVEPASHFNLIRLGLSLYGLWPSPLAKRIALRQYPWLKLKPALTWKTRIIQVKDIPAGTKVGYGCTHTTKKKTKMAVLGVGYWEGYDRHLSNPPSTSFRRAGKGQVVIKNKKCPVIGRVCMNLFMVDVSQVKGVKAGDEVVLLGEEVSAEEIAEKIGTINYEVITQINPVLERRYLK